MRKQGHRTIRENCRVPAMKTKRLIQSIAIQGRGNLYIDFSGNWIRALVSKLLSGLHTVSVWYRDRTQLYQGGHFTLKLRYKA